ESLTGDKFLRGNRTYRAENVSQATGVLTPLATSAIFAFPDCTYSGQTVSLVITNSTSTATIIQNATFQVPQCRLKRDIVVINNGQSGNVQTVNVGYQIQNLQPGTNYMATYSSGGISGPSFQFSTRTVYPAVANIMARSGGMVVITVLLSIAMFVLLAGLIAVLILGRK
uniref:Uroplakin 2 n=1 Tax=Xenopus tropicalis TaxID=8364 RepID=A0A803K0N2_XENTR